ncbi:MAG: zinc ABC transporter substrate-binding protein, partial [Planctomycetota bacterium]|nr:zinc ABC transporter substrate-binding protein [Planctomycetota bacterium]
MRGILFACVAALTACAPSDGSTDGGPLRIVATTGQVADAARVVGGDDVVVDALMGPGVDPHLYKASAGDLEKLRKADVVFYNGKGLEGKMADVLAKLARKKRVRAVSESIPDRDLLRPKELEGHYDPHIWFDVKLWIKAVNVIMSELAEAAPAQADTFRANAARFKRELAALDAQIRTGLNEIPKERRVLIT